MSKEIISNGASFIVEAVDRSYNATRNEMIKADGSTAQVGLAFDRVKVSPVGVGFYGVNPQGQPSSVGSAVQTAAGAGAAVKVDSTTTGGLGTTAYTIADIVHHLKVLGLIKS